MAQSDREEISEFIRQLARDLGAAITTPADLVLGIDTVELYRQDQLLMEIIGTSLVHESVASEARAAWTSVADRFPAVLEALDPERPTFPLDLRLEEVGLTGVELQFKLVGYRTFRLMDPPPSADRLAEVARAPREQRRREQLRRWFRRQLARFSRALDFANVILGSLGAAGVVVAEPIKEMKEALEAALRED